MILQRKWWPDFIICLQLLFYFLILFQLNAWKGFSFHAEWIGLDNNIFSISKFDDLLKQAVIILENFIKQADTILCGSDFLVFLNYFFKFSINIVLVVVFFVAFILSELFHIYLLYYCLRIKRIGLILLFAAFGIVSFLTVPFADMKAHISLHDYFVCICLPFYSNFLAK